MESQNVATVETTSPGMDALSSMIKRAVAEALAGQTGSYAYAPDNPANITPVVSLAAPVAAPSTRIVDAAPPADRREKLARTSFAKITRPATEAELLELAQKLRDRGEITRKECFKALHARGLWAVRVVAELKRRGLAHVYAPSGSTGQLIRYGPALAIVNVPPAATPVVARRPRRVKPAPVEKTPMAHTVTAHLKIRTWRGLQRKANRKGLTPSAAAREAIKAWLRTRAD